MPHTGHEQEARASRARQVTPVEWRRARLVETGFSIGLADRLARDDRYDLHRLIELAEQGCPPRLAARILAPLGDERTAR